MQRKRLVLVDGSAVFYRGYHALPPTMTNRAGEPTNALYGFSNIFLKMLSDLKPDYVIVAWDKSSQTFRKEMYAEYKATRKATPEDLKAQIPTLKKLVAALNLPFIEMDRYEADDIIGTLAALAEKRGDLETIIVTGDLDELQLVDENTVVRIAKPNGEAQTYDIAAVHERYGVTPQQFIDVKALKGDASDNIPGVPGIGEKGAMSLIAKYGSLDAVYEHVDEQTAGLAKKLTEGKELAYLSQELSKIICDIPMELDIEAAKVGHHDREKLNELFHYLDFRSLLAKLPPDMKAASASPVTTSNTSINPSLFDDESTPDAIVVRDRKHLETATYKGITTQTELDSLITELKAQPVFAFDTETTSVDTFVADLVGLSFSWQDETGFYIPVGHATGTQLNRDEVIAALKPIMEDPNIGKTGHNIKFDVEMLLRYGVDVQGIVFDTMIAAFLINSLGRSQSLDDLAYNEFGVEMIPISELIGKKGKDQSSFDAVPVEDAIIYASEDADMSWRLYKRLKPRLVEDGLEELAASMEWPLISVLAHMEMAGIELDVPFLNEFAVRLNGSLSDLKVQIYDLAGEEFNLGSPAQLAQILYGRLGLSTVGLKKGKTGFSTAAGELEKLRDAHPIVSLIMQYRELEKLRGTYVEALPDMVKSDGRVHTSFSQTIVASGRLSSNNPNLQNIPVRSELGREVRRAFVAPKGRVFVSADYSQIELRVAAALAHDEAMIQTFKDGVDLHVATAAELYAIPLADVTKDQRAAAKTINFGVLYGMSAHGLSVATGMDGKEAQGFIDRYFEVRPKLKAYIEDTKAFGRRKGYTATLFGRRRACPEINSSNFSIRQGAERVAVNIPIQGTAADIYKLAMVAVTRKLDSESKLLLQIHDELIVETTKDKAEAVSKLLKDTMEQVYDIGVPLAVDVAVGTNWGEL